MIIDTSILNTKYYHSIRGAIDFGDRIKDSQEFLSEYFVEQFTKQISPKFAELLGVNITRLKRRDAEFLSDQYLGNSNIIFYNGVWYIKTLILLSNYGAYFWCICDSQEDFSPWNVDRKITLDFEIVFNIPKEVRMKSLEHLLERARKETDLKRLKEIEKAYNSLVNVTVHDEWIGRCKEILGVNN